MASLFLMVGAVWAQIPATSIAPADGQWNADTKWYTIQCNDNSKGYISLQHADANANLMLNNSGKPAGVDGLWCVVGNDTDGYQFYNYASGTAKVLGSTGSDGSSRMKMYDVDGNVNGVTYKFDIKKLDDQDGYAFVKQKNSERQWWNNRDNYLSYWNNDLAYTSGCSGSQYMFVEVSIPEFVASYKTSAISALTTIGTFAEVVDAKTAVEAINAVDLASLADIDAVMEGVYNSLGYLAFRNSDENQQAPSRINAYLATRSNREKGHGTNDLSNWPNFVWSLKYAGGGEFYLYNAVQELYLGSPTSNGSLSEAPIAKYSFELIDTKKVEFKCSAHTLHLNNHSDGLLSNHDQNDPASRWYIETNLVNRLDEFKDLSASVLNDAKTLVAKDELKNFGKLTNMKNAVTAAEGTDFIAVVKGYAELIPLVPVAKEYLDAIVAFNLKPGKLYALQEETSDLYLDIQTMGIHEPGYTTNSISLNATPCAIYLEAGGAPRTWKLKSAAGKYAQQASSRNWNAVIGTTAYEWTFTDPTEDLHAIARADGKFMNVDTKEAGKPLYCDKDSGMKFRIVEFPMNSVGVYALKSVTGTYLNLTSGGTSQISFRATPSCFKKIPSANGFAFQSVDDATKFVGNTHSWNATTEFSVWQISEPDNEGWVTISRTSDANYRLGSDTDTNVGTGIYTNVGNNCNKWILEECYPLTITYMYEGAKIENLKVDTYVTPGTVYTIENKPEHNGKVIASCKIGETEVTGVNGFWTITVNATTAVEVTLVDDVPEETNLYALQSPSGTFFNFTPKVVHGETTQASFQSTPSFVYKNENNGSFVFQSVEDATKYIGYDATAAAYWLTTTNESYWTISEADEKGFVAISRVDAESNGLGSDDNTNVDTGIFTNAGSAEGNVCNRWKLLHAYPLTINYVCNGKTLSTIKDAVIAGASYFAEIDTHGGTLVSCVTDKGIMNVKDGHLSFAKVTAATTITITLEGAMEPGTLQIDNWKVSYEPATNGIKLTGATIIDESGSGALVIPSTCTIGDKTQSVVAISPDFLHGNTKVTSVTLPASLVNLGFRKVEPMFVGSYEGQLGDGTVIKNEDGTTTTQGMNSCYIFPNDPHTGKPFMINKKTAWRLTLDVTIDDVKDDFNEFGSAIVSTKANSLDDYYTNHMQIYLHDGHKDIIVKMNNSDDRYKYNTYVLDGTGNETNELLVNTHFKFELEHDGTGGYQIVIYYENGKAKMYNITADNNIVDFDRLYYSLPEGIHVDVKFDRLVSEGLFVGCTSLQEIIVDPANPTFKSCEHGVLYDKNGYYVMRIPEGETGHHFEIPSKVVKLYAGAVHGVTADIVLHSNPDIGKVEGHDEYVKNAKFYLSLDDIDPDQSVGGARDFVSANTNTYQSANYKRAPLKAGVYGTICLPFAIVNDVEEEDVMDKYDFFKFKSGNATSLTFSQVTELKANDPYLYKLKEGVASNYNLVNGYDVFKSTGEVTIVTKDKYDPKQHKPGTYHALGSFVNYYVETAKYPNSAFYYYSLSQEKFLKVTEKLTYRPYRAFFVVTPEVGGASQAPARLSLCLLDGTTTDIDASLVEGMETPVYYDLSGRRVLNPGSGVYIVNGKKVFIK